MGRGGGGGGQRSHEQLHATNNALAQIIEIVMETRSNGLVRY